MKSRVFPPQLYLSIRKYIAVDKTWMDEESCKKGIRKIHLLSTPRSNDYNNLLDTMQAYSKRSLLPPFSTTKIEKLTKLRPSEEASFDWIELIRSWSEIANSTLIEAVVLLESLNDSLRTRDAARRRNYCRLVRGQGKWDLTDVPACESHSVALVPGVWLREEGGEGQEGEARGVVISRQELWRLQKRIVSFPPSSSSSSWRTTLRTLRVSSRVH